MTGQGAGRRCKLARFNPHALQHADVEIAKRRIVVPVKSEMLTMLQSTSRNEDRHVGGGVFARVTEIASVEKQGVVEQASVRQAE